MINNNGYIYGFELTEQEAFDDFKVQYRAGTYNANGNDYLVCKLDDTIVFNAWRALQAITTIKNICINLNRFGNYCQPLGIYEKDTNASASFRTLTSIYLGTFSIDTLPSVYFNKLSCSTYGYLTNEILIDIYLGNIYLGRGGY